MKLVWAGKELDRLESRTKLAEWALEVTGALGSECNWPDVWNVSLERAAVQFDQMKPFGHTRTGPRVDWRNTSNT